MEGLEVSVVRLSEIDEFNESLRLDAEFFGKFPLHIVARVKASTHSSITDVVKRIQHPIEIAREYEESGLLTIMAGNVRDNFVSLDDQRFMPETARALVAKNRLQAGDVLMTRTGANFGNTAPWKHSEIEAFACADVLVFREPSIPSGYLSSYLSSKAGQALVIRGGYGMAQPHIAPSYLQNMIVPRFDKLEWITDQLVEQSNDLGRAATASLAEAEAALLSALGLAGWTPPEPLSYTARAADALTAARLDAQYFMPSKLQMIEALRAMPGQPLGARFKSVREMFDPAKAAPDLLVRNFDLPDALEPILDDDKEPASSGDIGSLKKGMKNGDVAMSRLRAYLKETAVVRTGTSHPAVGSSEFIVLRPIDAKANRIAPETLMIFLRSAPVQTILKWCQDGSQHPRFSERDLLAIPVPDAVADASAEIEAMVQSAFTARARSRALLSSAKRAVEIAIEQGEDVALAFLAGSGEGRT